MAGRIRSLQESRIYGVLSPMKPRAASWWAAICRALRFRNALPCVGLVVLGGCLTLIIAPDDNSARYPGQQNDTGLPMVIVDPGHGGKDDGTKWRGLAEKDLTLDVGRRLEAYLKEAGFPTRITRTDNTFISLEERTRMGNDYDDAVFVSIHFNSSTDTESSGVQVHYPVHKNIQNPEWDWAGFFSKSQKPVSNPKLSEELAGVIVETLANRTMARNRGIHADDFYVIHHTRCPAVLVEAGFVSNLFEAQLLTNSDYRDRIARGIAEGVASYVKSHPRQPTPPAPRTSLAQVKQ